MASMGCVSSVCFSSWESGLPRLGVFQLRAMCRVVRLYMFFLSLYCMLRSTVVKMPQTFRAKMLRESGGFNRVGSHIGVLVPQHPTLQARRSLKRPYGPEPENPEALHAGTPNTRSVEVPIPGIPQTGFWG